MTAFSTPTVQAETQYSDHFCDAALQLALILLARWGVGISAPAEGTPCVCAPGSQGAAHSTSSDRLLLLTLKGITPWFVNPVPWIPAGPG